MAGGNKPRKGGGGKGGGSGSASEDAQNLSAMPESKIQQEVVPKTSVNFSTAVASDQAAESLGLIISMGRDNTPSYIQSAIDRADWSSSYKKPSDNLMRDAIGSGFVVSLGDLKRLNLAANDSRLNASAKATVNQARELMKYKLNTMWAGASTSGRAAALKQLTTRRAAEELGLVFD